MTTVNTPPTAGREARPERPTLLLTVLCASAFMAAVNFLATSPFYRDMASDLDTSVPLLGQVITLMVIISAVLGLAVGPFADLYGYRRPLVVGLLTITANLIGTALAPSYGFLFALSLVGGLGDAIVFGLALALAGMKFEGDERRRAISWTIAALSSGAIIGVPILTFIGDSAGWRVAVASAGVFSLLIAMLVLLVLPADARHPETRFRVRSMIDAYSPLRSSPPTLRLFAITVFRATWLFGLLTYLGAFLADDLDLATRQIGLVYTLAGIGASVGSLVAGSRFVTLRPRLLIAGTNILAGCLLMPMLGLPSIAGSIPLLFAVAFFAAMAGVGIATLLTAESPTSPGTTMALNGSLLNAGAAAGAGVGGACIALGGYAGLAVGLPVFALLAAGLALWPSAMATSVEAMADP